ncbi:receptor-type tyrosine-protein phosphatase eta-like [Pleurodeles waltl]|uniref:receptor-type tyrosine-protein phosphatase eta-like n=1 Tax=Pleurodeles waltl TaxID=8319 RepID=UPI00370956A1
MLAKGAIEEVSVQHRGLGFYSRFFLIRKTSGEWRPNLDLRKLNKFLRKQSFHMITLLDILHLLNPGDYMTTMDPQDAYFHTPVHVKHRKYLRFTVAGGHYQFKVLPFGLKSAPQIFTKCLAPVAGYLPNRGFQVFPYLDDWLIKASSSQLASKATNVCLELFHSLGLIVNFQKSVTLPTRRIVFLGAELDTIENKAYVTQARQQKLANLVSGSQEEVPNVTNNLKVTDVSVDSISLSWLPPTGNKSLYFVQVIGNPAFNLTSYTEFVLIINLTPGNHYTFLVSAVAGNGVLGKSSIISEYTVPNVTKNLKVTDVSVDSILLSWLPPTGNKSFYFVQVLGNPAFNLTSYTEFVLITNLTPGNHYTLLVSAVAGNGVLGNSNIMTEYKVPHVTKDLNVTDVSIDSISLSWLPPTGNKSFYYVQVSGNPAFNLTSYSEFVLITNLTPGNHYTFLVSAVAGNGVLGNSSIIAEYTVPNVTNNLKVTDVSVDSISLSWLPPTGNKSWYFVQVLGNPAFILTSYTEFVLITNLTPGNHYTFLVSAVAGNGVLGNSSIITEYTVPNVTNNLKVTDVSVDSISLSWLPPTGNKSFYFVQVSGNPTFNLTSYSEFVLITNLTPGNHYTFLVSAVAGNGVLGNSSIIAEYTVSP